MTSGKLVQSLQHQLLVLGGLRDNPTQLMWKTLLQMKHVQVISPFLVEQEGPLHFGLCIVCVDGVVLCVF